MPAMARFRLGRRLGPVGVVLTAYDIWKRLPPKQRKQMLDLARKHGPRVATRIMQARRRARGRRV
jgi:TRAP-type C4-dicarboxylate transport system substrate-binding protein